VTWLTDDWRLKLLALGLSVLLLGAVAFSQNPPSIKTVQVQLRYTTVGDSANPLVIINPPSKTNITFSGLADAVGSATADNFTATVDATHATPGAAVKLNIIVTPTINGLNVQAPPPIIVRIDNFVAVSVPVTVAPHFQAGWVQAPNGIVVTPATVHFVGPASWEDHLTATVVVGAPIAITHTSLLNQSVQLTNNNGAVPIPGCTTVPCATLDPASVAVDITAQTGASSLTVVLVDDVPSALPPSGYHISGVTVSPATVIITGDPASLAKVQRIVLPKVDLSSATSTYQAKVQIPYPAGTAPLSGVQTATVTYTIEKNPAVSPSPSPSP
jgi:YbbR domain-containing protein